MYSYAACAVVQQVAWLEQTQRRTAFFCIEWRRIYVTGDPVAFIMLIDQGCRRSDWSPAWMARISRRVIHGEWRSVCVGDYTMDLYPKDDVSVDSGILSAAPLAAGTLELTVSVVMCLISSYCQDGRRVVWVLYQLGDRVHRDKGTETEKQTDKKRDKPLGLCVLSGHRRDNLPEIVRRTSYVGIKNKCSIKWWL